MKSIITTLFPLLFVLIGGLMIWFGIDRLQLAFASADWPSVQGEIVASEVDRHTGHRKGVNRTKYDAELDYVFIVNGVKYEGTRINFGSNGSGDRDEVEAIVAQYPQGRKLDVYYQPDDPEVCVLEPGFSAGALLLPGIGLLFFLIGAVITLAFLGRVRRLITG